MSKVVVKIPEAEDEASLRALAASSASSIEAAALCDVLPERTPGPMAHPFLQHLPQDMAAASVLVQRSLQSWTCAWEQWMAEVSLPSGANQRRYLGRGAPPAWKKVKVVDNRSSPVKAVHVAADLGKAERSLECEMW